MRKALLIAVAKHEDAGLDLDYVRQDVPHMRRALKAMGVAPDDVRVLGADGNASHGFVSPAKMETAIEEFLEKAKKDDDLIVYFSGHGADIDGHRVLIPQDFDPKRPRPESLVNDLDLQRMARRSPAGSVLFLIDTCRDGYDLTLEPTKGLGNGAPDDALADDHRDHVPVCDVREFVRQHPLELLGGQHSEQRVVDDERRSRTTHRERVRFVESRHEHARSVDRHSRRQRVEDVVHLGRVAARQFASVQSDERSPGAEVVGEIAGQQRRDQKHRRQRE